MGSSYSFDSLWVSFLSFASFYFSSICHLWIYRCQRDKLRISYSGLYGLGGAHHFGSRYWKKYSRGVWPWSNLGHVLYFLGLCPRVAWSFGPSDVIRVEPSHLVWGIFEGGAKAPNASSYHQVIGSIWTHLDPACPQYLEEDNWFFLFCTAPWVVPTMRMFRAFF